MDSCSFVPTFFATSTLFNGAGSVAQAGAVAVLNNLDAAQETVNFYMENAAIVRECFDELGFEYAGGV